MAEYRKLAADLVAADGQIDDTETRLLKKHLYADGKIVRAEIDFLLEVKTAVNRKSKSTDETVKFDRFMLKACQDFLLEAGKKIGEADLALVKKMATEKKIDQAEVKKFLNKLKKELPNNDAIAKIHEDFNAKA